MSDTNGRDPGERYHVRGVALREGLRPGEHSIAQNADLQSKYGPPGNPEHLDRLRAANQRLRGEIRTLKDMLAAAGTDERERHRKLIEANRKLRAENDTYRQTDRAMQDELGSLRHTVRRLKARLANMQHMVAARAMKPGSPVLEVVGDLAPAIMSAASYIRAVYEGAGMEPPEYEID